MKESLVLYLLLSTAVVICAQAPKIVLPIGHAGFINSIHFNEDGNKLVTSGSDHTAKVWDANTGLLIMDFQGHREPVLEASFDNGSERILTASSDGSARVWNARSGKELFSVNETFGVKHASFNADGSRIITTSQQISANLWDGKSGKKIANLCDTTNFWEVNFSPNGKLLAAACWNDTIALWDAITGKLKLGIHEKALLVEFSQDSKWILSGSLDKSAKLWSTETGKLKKRLEGHRAAVVAVAFSKNGEKIVTVSSDGNIKIWKLNGGDPILTANWPKAGFKKSSCSISFQNDDNSLLVSDGDGNNVLLDIKTGKSQRSIEAEFITYSRKNNKVATVIQSEAMVYQANDFSDPVSLRGHVFWAVNAEIDKKGERMLITYGDGSLRTWNAQSGMPEHLLRHDKTTMAIFNPDGTKIAAALANGDVMIYNSATGKLTYPLKGHSDRVSFIQFSDNGDRLLSLSDDKTVKIWEVATGKLQATLAGHNDIIYAAAFSPDGQKVATGSQDKSAIIWEASTGKLLSERKFDNWVTDASFNNAGTRVAFVVEHTVYVQDASEKKTLFEISLPGDYSGNVDYSTDDKFIITSSDVSGFVRIYDAMTGRGLHELIGDTPFANGPETRSDNMMWTYSVTQDRGKIVTGRGDGLVQVWDFRTGKFLFDLPGHTDIVHKVLFSQDGQRVLSLSKDATVKVWDVKSKLLLYTFFPVDSNGYFIQNRQGYYHCTPNTARLLHYITPAGEVIDFDQLDIRFNRPDLVLVDLQPKDKILIERYHQAYLKRMRDLHIDTTNFSDDFYLPTLQIINRDRIDYKQTRQMLKLQCKATDSLHKFQNLNVWVNEVPVYGSKGIDLSHIKGHDFDTTLTIALSEGINQIEIAVRNNNGASSYRYPKQVLYQPDVLQKSQEKLYFIGLASSKFFHPGHSLQWCVDDIKALASAFKKKFGNAVIIDTLFDNHVTVTRVKAIKELLKRSTVNDKVVIAFSGHGLLSKTLQYFLSTYDINFDKPEVNGLLYEQLYDLLDSIPARRKAMFIDACNSGELDTASVKAYEGLRPKLEAEGVKGTIVSNIDTARFGLRQLYALTQELFVDVRKKVGANIIAASSALELAKEDNSLRYGVFTYSILEAFQKNRSLSINQLKRIVETRVPEITKGLQRPTSRDQTINSNWLIW